VKKLNVISFCIVLILQSFCGLVSGNSAHSKVNTCGRENISIYYEIEEDYIITCEGIDRAEEFFTTLGYAVETQVTIYFSHQATVREMISGHEAIYGYFDPDTMSIFISSLASPFVRNSERVYFNIEFQPGFMLEEYHKSVVAHETAHLFAQHIFNLKVGAGVDKPKMGHGVQEYIASVVQLSSMEPALLQRILRQYATGIIFDDEQQINSILFACNPEIFAIMSYRHFHSLNTNQQRVLLDRMFSNDLNPDLVFELGH